MAKEIAYVVGFMFSEDNLRVALIRKTKPPWQVGKLNGIGGKINPGEWMFEAMVREFHEETGSKTTVDQWAYYLSMNGINDDGLPFRVECFATLGDVSSLRTMEGEKIEVVYTRTIHPLRDDMIENLPWLIALALDHLHDGRPAFVRAKYAPSTGGAVGTLNGEPCNLSATERSATWNAMK
jgi:8-oxo-dGTP pyrophosphatase MutT (NUDIX family)